MPLSGGLRFACGYTVSTLFLLAVGCGVGTNSFPLGYIDDKGCTWRCHLPHQR
jgi:hypothetical protein